MLNLLRIFLCNSVMPLHAGIHQEIYIVTVGASEFGYVADLSRKWRSLQI